MNNTISPIPQAITAEVTLRRAPKDGHLASAVVEVGEDIIPGFKVMRGKYCLYVAYPTGELLLSRFTAGERKRMADVVMMSYNAIRKVVAA